MSTIIMNLIVCLTIFISYMVLNTDIIVEGKSNKFSLNPSCGKEFNENQLATRVFGGSQTSDKDHPSLAILLFNNVFRCGGTIICSQFILTAAHCVTNKLFNESYVVKLGVHDRIALLGKNIKTYPVKQVIKHEDFEILRHAVLINDIALLKVDSIEFTHYIQPICLPTIPDTGKYKAAIIEGWGVATMDNDLTSSVPRHAILSLLETKECQKSPIYKVIQKIKNIDLMTMCAHKFNTDSCSGDSGGPLYIKTQNGQSVQIGIVSFGVKCLSGHPGIYTRLTTYLPWIKKQLKNTECGEYIFNNK